MRCYCCNNLLSDFESTRKIKGSNEYADMCNKCASTIEEDVGGFTGRADLDPNMVNDEDLTGEDDESQSDSV